MVELAQKVEGVYGARMTGGGFGGSTVNLVRTENVEDFRARIKLNSRTPITRIRTLQLSEFYVLLVGSRCIQVLGEP